MLWLEPKDHARRALFREAIPYPQILYLFVFVCHTGDVSQVLMQMRYHFNPQINFVIYGVR